MAAGVGSSIESEELTSHLMNFSAKAIVVSARYSLHRTLIRTASRALWAGLAILTIGLGTRDVSAQVVNHSGTISAQTTWFSSEVHRIPFW